MRLTLWILCASNTIKLFFFKVILRSCLYPAWTESVWQPRNDFRMPNQVNLRSPAHFWPWMIFMLRLLVCQIELVCFSRFPKSNLNHANTMTKSRSCFLLCRGAIRELASFLGRFSGNIIYMAYHFLGENTIHNNVVCVHLAFSWCS